MKNNFNGPATGPDLGALMVEAVVRNDIGSVRRFLERGIDASSKNEAGITGLMKTVADDAADIACLLLEYGADADTKDQAGMTALMRAAKDDALGVAETLVAAGAVLDLKNQDGKTAVEIANDSGHIRIANLFSVAAEERAAAELLRARTRAAGIRQSLRAHRRPLKPSMGGA